ncbi:hypothetical protein RPE78_16980 (plasmid) [Thioclava litoralis]|uniref:Glycosyl transferase family 2 n=1 Tax=Thioclava litoralis TaxID=3076557 RepID=A0ABZ1E6N1_9RHOB|nr:hypothetical protein RPE78_16980 [Thioclava sp. FTW29]
MLFSSLDDLASKGQSLFAKGPVALILVEDEVELDSTLAHHLNCGFREVIAFMPQALPLPEGFEARVHRVDYDTHEPGATVAAVNLAISLTPPKVWLYYCYNAEYLFYPFSETRRVGEMLAFHTEERRPAMLTYVIDLYTADLEANPNGVNREDAMLDRAGYYALARLDPENHNHPKERQLDFFGGLRWRFEEHVRENRRKIDRIGLFSAAQGLTLRADHTFSDEEYNTYSCPWHHNLTGAILSFRAAKALKTNPGSSWAIQDFRWYNAEPFQWNSQQLLDLGLIEPGQWF